MSNHGRLWYYYGGKQTLGILSMGSVDAQDIRVLWDYGLYVFLGSSAAALPCNLRQHEIETEITTGNVLRGFLPRRARGLVSEWRERYVDELLENWELARDHRPLRQVPPLD
jgi:hypothetical protein